MPKKRKTTIIETASPLSEQDLEISRLETALQAISPDTNLQTKPVTSSVSTSGSDIDAILDALTGELEELPDRADFTPEAGAKLSVSEDALSSFVPQKFSEFDRSVLEGAMSEIFGCNATHEPSNAIFTAAMLYRTITGKGSSEPVSAEQRKAVDDSVLKAMRSLGTFKYSTVSQDGTVTETEITEPLLPAKKIRVKVNGNEASGYRIEHVPQIYRYSLIHNQLNYTPIAMISSVNVSSTKRNIGLINVLQRNVAPFLFIDAQHGEEIPEPIYIDYDVLYAVEQTPGKPLENVERSRTRATVHKILDAWVSCGYLAGYQDIRPAGSRTKISGVEIRFKPRRPRRPYE